MKLSSVSGPTVPRSTRAATTDMASAATLGPGSLLGRYVVLERVGRGGMGVVYAAYDPVLERKIALKLLRIGGADSTAAQAQRAQLVREAQAMARLSHPNVVTVHDVGQAGDEVFIAMEFVDGGTLGTALAAGDRSAAQVLDLFLAAGRGLEAAHRAGIVHRDFKPDNVLVGADGRVLVTDFGIARLAAAEVSLREERFSETTQDGQETEATGGPTPGTPAYMSAEQHLGLPADERSDQFSFCVALWEGLYGQRPFEGQTIAALAVAATHGHVREPPNAGTVSPTLRVALDRGLSPDPAQRFASMGDLLSALAPLRRPIQRWQLPAFLGLVATGAIGWGVWAQAQPEPCGGGGAEIAEVWGDAQRSAIQAAWAAKGQVAATAGEGVIRSLDRYETNWIATHRETCEATRIRGERSEQLLDLGMACLMGRRAALDAAVRLLAEPDEAVLRRGLDIAGGIPGLEPCADVQAMSRLEPPPDDAESGETIEALRASLGRSSALLNAGKYAESRAEAELAGKRAEQLDYPPLQSEVLLRLGVARLIVGEPDLAFATLVDAYFMAASHRDELSAARAAGEVLYALADKGEYEGAMLWYRHADAALARIGRSANDDARLANGLGVVRAGQGKFDEAVTAYERALEVQPDPAGVGAANAINDLAMVYENQGKYKDAVELHGRAKALRVAMGGPEHPEVADSLNNIGLALHNMGDLEGAREHYEQAIAIYTKALGPENLALTSPLNNLGSTLDALGRSDEAKTALTRTLAIRKAHLEADDPLIASVYKSLGRHAANEGDYALALEQYKRALDVYEVKLGSDHPFIGEVVYLIAEATRNSGALGEAEPHYARALAVFEAAFPKGHPFIGIVKRDHARLAMQLGQADVAQARAEEAVALIRASLGDGHAELAIAESVLARALHAQGAFEDARRHWEASIAIREADTQREDVPLFYGYIGLATANVALGDPDAAAATIAKAAEVAFRYPDRSDVAGALAFARARVSRLRGVEDESAATVATESYVRAGADYADELAEVQAWRAAKPKAIH